MIIVKTIPHARIPYNIIKSEYDAIIVIPSNIWRDDWRAALIHFRGFVRILNIFRQPTYEQGFVLLVYYLNMFGALHKN